MQSDFALTEVAIPLNITGVEYNYQGLCSIVITSDYEFKILINRDYVKDWFFSKNSYVLSGLILIYI